MGLAVARDYSIYDAFEGRVSGTHGDEVPEHSPQGGGGHRQKLTEGIAGEDPGEACAPVSASRSAPAPATAAAMAGVDPANAQAAADYAH